VLEASNLGSAPVLSPVAEVAGRMIATRCKTMRKEQILVSTA
jgi:hypothetical protein